MTIDFKNFPLRDNEPLTNYEAFHSGRISRETYVALRIIIQLEELSTPNGYDFWGPSPEARIEENRRKILIHQASHALKHLQNLNGEEQEAVSSIVLIQGPAMELIRSAQARVSRCKTIPELEDRDLLPEETWAGVIRARDRYARAIGTVTRRAVSNESKSEFSAAQYERALRDFWQTRAMFIYHTEREEAELEQMFGA